MPSGCMSDFPAQAANDPMLFQTQLQTSLPFEGWRMNLVVNGGGHVPRFGAV